MQELETARLIRTSTAFPEDPGLIPSLAAHYCLQLQFLGMLFVSDLHRSGANMVHINVGKMHTCIKTKQILKKSNTHTTEEQGRNGEVAL